jgi:dTDP-4-amino-4,6-dideoxygalactose transaminase
MDSARPALEGGAPVRAAFLPFARPHLGAEEEQAVIEVLRSGWLGTGPRTRRFEERFAVFVGSAHAVAVGSCTAGLHLVLRALGVGAGDQVVTSPLTFAATANAILQVGAIPVFADVLPRRLTLDPAAVRGVLNRRVRAIVAVHLAGWPCDMDGLNALAAAAGVPVIEDASHALGATYRGRAAGVLGEAAVFSFYATKNITTGEGGMITTDNVGLVPQLRRERLHGMDLDASHRAGTDFAHWEAVSMGWKYNLTDLQAALGLVQLDKLPVFLARRRQLDARYRERLRTLESLDALEGPQGAEGAAHLFPVLLRPGALRIGRDAMLKALLAENIGVGVHFRALPLHRHFRETVPTRPETVPVAMDASERLLSLPLYPGMSDRDQDDVVEALARIGRYYRA